MLDFATSRIAQGKTRVAYNKGVPIAPGTIIDDQGNPTTDPRYTVVEPFGALLTFGEHKGSGLALVCELLGGALTGGETATSRLPTARRQVLNGMLSIVDRPAASSAPPSTLPREVEAFVDWYAASPPAAGVDRVHGRRRARARSARRERLADGIPVDAGHLGRDRRRGREGRSRRRSAERLRRPRLSARGAGGLRAPGAGGRAPPQSVSAGSKSSSTFAPLGSWQNSCHVLDSRSRRRS